MNGKGWRLFDVAINNKTVIKDLDIWSKAGNGACKQDRGQCMLRADNWPFHFQTPKLGQAVIAAIAITAKAPNAKGRGAITCIDPVASLSERSCIGKESKKPKPGWTPVINNTANSNIAFTALPPTLYGAEWIQMPVMPAAEKLSNLAVFCC